MQTFQVSRTIHLAKFVEHEFPYIQIKNCATSVSGFQQIHADIGGVEKKSTRGATVNRRATVVSFCC